jgi:predicted GNAT superfamily acetyltransferase
VGVISILSPERADELTELADQAEAVAAAAAQRAGLQVDLLHELPDLQAAMELLACVWGTEPELPPVNRDLMRAFVHSGNYVAGARLAGELVGVSVGFLGRHGQRVVLHSHITGVSAAAQGHSAGFALKQHQRAWAMRRGLTEITWTFDPLIRRNAYFNLAKLRAKIVAYEPAFYGPMGDRINAGDESDRCVILWSLTDPDVVAASSENGSSPAVPDSLPPGEVVLAEDGDGRPVLSKSDTPEAPVLVAQIPADIVATRIAAPDLAIEWRHALRTTFRGAVDAGYEAVRMTRSGWYTLERGQ